MTSAPRMITQGSLQPLLLDYAELPMTTISAMAVPWQSSAPDTLPDEVDGDG